VACYQGNVEAVQILANEPCNVDVFARSTSGKMPKQVCQNSVMGKMMGKIEKTKIEE